MIILIPINSYVATKIKRLQIMQMKIKDKRIKLMSEILSGIKVRLNTKIRLYEKSFAI